MIQAGRVPSSVPMAGILQIAALLSPTRGNAGNLTRNGVANRRRRPLGGRILVGTAAIVILLVLQSAALAIPYTFTTLDVPGATSTEAFGINRAGQIVGLYSNATGEHGFLKNGATFTSIAV